MPQNKKQKNMFKVFKLKNVIATLLFVEIQCGLWQNEATLGHFSVLPGKKLYLRTLLTSSC